MISLIFFEEHLCILLHQQEAIVKGGGGGAAENGGGLGGGDQHIMLENIHKNYLQRLQACYDAMAKLQHFRCVRITTDIGDSRECDCDENVRFAVQRLNPTRMFGQRPGNV